MARHSSTYRCNRPRVRTGAERRAALREQRLAALVTQAAASVPATPAEEPVADAATPVVDLAEQRRQRKNELARARRAAKKLAA
jgi:hypothetical protein